MTFKHDKLGNSEVMRELEAIAIKKGMMKPLQAVKTASVREEFSISDNFNVNVISLCNGLRARGLSKYAEELEGKYLAMKQAEAMYDVQSKKENELLEMAHPDGSAILKDMAGDNVIETLGDQQKKMIEVLNKEPTGKVKNAKALVGLINIYAQTEPVKSEREPSFDEIIKLRYEFSKIEFSKAEALVPKLIDLFGKGLDKVLKKYEGFSYIPNMGDVQEQLSPIVGLLLSGDGQKITELINKLNDINFGKLGIHSIEKPLRNAIQKDYGVPYESLAKNFYNLVKTFSIHINVARDYAEGKRDDELKKVFNDRLNNPPPIPASAPSALPQQPAQPVILDEKNKQLVYFKNLADKLGKLKLSIKNLQYPAAKDDVILLNENVDDIANIINRINSTNDVSDIQNYLNEERIQIEKNYEDIMKDSEPYRAMEYASSKMKNFRLF